MEDCRAGQTARLGLWLLQNRLPRVSWEEPATWSKGQGWMAEALPPDKKWLPGGSSTGAGSRLAVGNLTFAHILGTLPNPYYRGQYVTRLG